MQHLGVSEGQMQMGHMRFEPNINVHITDEAGDVHKTAITEIKNLNSFNVLEKATAYEVAPADRPLGADAGPEAGPGQEEHLRLGRGRPGDLLAAGQGAGARLPLLPRPGPGAGGGGRRLAGGAEGRRSASCPPPGASATPPCSAATPGPSRRPACWRPTARRATSSTPCCPAGAEPTAGRLADGGAARNGQRAGGGGHWSWTPGPGRVAEIAALVSAGKIAAGKETAKALIAALAEKRPPCRAGGGGPGADPGERHRRHRRRHG